MNDSIVKMPSCAVSAARVVVGFWLLGWFLKWAFFRPYLFQTIVDYPFLNDYFPAFFRSAHTAQFFYLLPLFTLPIFFRPQRFYFYLAALAMTVSSGILLLHQDTHNDATFVTSFWVGVWFLWFVSQMHRQEDSFVVHARSLALCVVGLVFWGGFVGKLTPEYWNGHILADIFMEQNFGALGGWVRGHVSEATVRASFQWIAKLVILGEGILALSPLWPYRFVCLIGIPFMATISIFTTWRIFSVLFCLIGVLLAGWVLEKKNR